MKIKVLVAQKYSVFVTVNGQSKAEAAYFNVGDILEAPDTYCNYLIEKGFGEILEEEEVVKHKEKPEKKPKKKNVDKKVVLTEGARRAFEASDLTEEELKEVVGTGKDGKIVARDIIEYVKAKDKE